MYYQKDLSVEDLTKNARSKSSIYFLEDPEGVGATTCRPYIKNLLAKKWCVFCSDGQGTCLGTGCMGARKPTLTTVVKTENERLDSTGEVPGQVGLFKGTRLTDRMFSGRSKLGQIPAQKYPCYFPKKSSIFAPLKVAEHSAKVMNYNLNI